MKIVYQTFYANPTWGLWVKVYSILARMSEQEISKFPSGDQGGGY